MPAGAEVCAVLLAWWTCGLRKGGLQWKLQCDVEGAKPRGGAVFRKPDQSPGGRWRSTRSREQTKTHQNQRLLPRRGDTPTADQIMPWRRWT